MKILLLYPFGTHTRIRTEEDAAQTPIGLYYLGAVLKEKGYEVEIQNWHTHSARPEDIAQDLLAFQPDVIGLSVFQANRHGAMGIASIAKKIIPNVKIVFGGVGATTLWEFFLTQSSNIDTIVLGEGEASFPQLLAEWEKSNPDLENVPGISFWKNGKLVRTKMLPPVILNELPDPANYYAFSYVVSSRGCPGGCRFCGSPELGGRKVRSHSADNFVTHLERLHQKGIRFFYISDDTFTLDKNRVIEICKEILRRSIAIEWATISRVDCVDMETLTWMRKAGCIQISYGVESADPAIRKWLGKKISGPDIQRAFDMSISVGILPRAYIIYGTWGETPDTAEITLQRLAEWKPLAAIFYMLEIFPGTRLYEEFLENTNASNEIWKDDIESIAWAEANNGPIQSVLETGKKLRDGYQKLLPQLVRQLELADAEDLKPYQADFLSRLAITFSHGEYAHTDDARETAGYLLNRSFTIYPNARTFWGKGLLAFENRQLKEAIEIFQEGLQLFPEDALTHIYMGYALLAHGKAGEALSHFEKYPTHPDAQRGLNECKRKLNLPH